MTSPAFYTRVSTIRPDNAGNLDTLNRLKQLASHPSARLHALRAMILGRTPGQSVEGVTLLFEFVRSNLTFRRDDPQAEEITTPDRLAWEIQTHGRAYEDCDGYVALLGALLVSAGIPTRLVAISTHEDRIWNHVALRASIDGLWIGLDPIVSFPIGWSVPEAEVTSRVEVALN